MSQLSTPPSQHDELFIYHSGGFAVRLDGDSTPFRRAEPDVIANMLRNDGVFASVASHFWRAQLAHYGLPSNLDTKEAKCLLQRAIHCGSLRVPKDILELENELAERWVVDHCFSSVSDTEEAEHLLQREKHRGSLCVPEDISDLEDRLRELRAAENTKTPREPCSKCSHSIYHRS